MSATPPDPDVVVRLARPSDLRHLAAVEDSGVALFREHLGESMVPALAAPAPSGSQRDAAGLLVVAADGDRVVGFAHLLVLPVDAAGGDGAAHLEQVSVLPSHGRRGVGARLVRAVMEEARWAGHDRISLATYRDLPWNGPFYRSLGFSEVERLAPHEERLRAHERALGLDAAGVRVVMAASLRR